MADITVIEDSKTILFLVKTLLEAQRHRVSLYTDGSSGLLAMRENSPDLLVLDIGLPDISGFKIAEFMRDDVALANVPILIITAFDDVKSRIKGLQVADDYLTKPFDKLEFTARVDALLRRSDTTAGLKGRLELIGGAGAAVQVVALVHPQGALIFDDSTIVYFHQGRVISITQRDKSLSPEEAVTEVFGRIKGGFRFEPSAELPKATLNLDPMVVLLEAARVNDETAEVERRKYQYSSGADYATYDTILTGTVNTSDAAHKHLNNALVDDLEFNDTLDHRAPSSDLDDGLTSAQRPHADHPHTNDTISNNMSTHIDTTEATTESVGGHNIKGEAVLQELLELIDIGVAEKALLIALQDKAKIASTKMVHAFYERLFAHENTKEYFAGVAMDHLYDMISMWFVELFSGNYDSKYVSKRIEVGQVHVRMGLPVRYPLAMLDVVSKYGLEVAVKSDQAEAARIAFLKVLSLDVAIFNNAYEDDKLRHLAELVGGERLARLLLKRVGQHEQ